MVQDRAVQTPHGTPRWVLVLSLIGLVLAGLGVKVLIDPHGGQNILAAIYDMLGNPDAANLLRNGLGDQFIAKLILAVIALLVGVGGIWMLFTGASTPSSGSSRRRATESSRGSSSARRSCS